MRWHHKILLRLRSLFQRKKVEAELDDEALSPGAGDSSKHSGGYDAGRGELFPARIAASVLGAFGLLAIVLAATGVFGLMAYAVSRRAREIGIRMALGARAGQVLELVLRRTVMLCVMGVIVGTGIAFGGGSVLSSVLYGVSPRDPVTYCLALLLMIAVALLACWYPAQRAIRIDPARTLREE
jgi:ABC-type antimicrobial peptide transport system permease subunit